MAESSKDELLQLIKRFGAYITVKMSNFVFAFKNMDSRSVGAIAGLAVAIVFTWRLLRSPSTLQRRPPKRQGNRASTSGVNSQSNPAQVFSEVSTSSEDSKAQNVVDGLFHPVKLTLGHIVRQRLCEGRKVTCRLAGVILEESSPEELQKQVTVRSSALEVLLEISKYCDLYLMERVVDDESEKRVLDALEGAGIFTSGSLSKDKVLFCSTENGRTSFVRQLEPDWHIDTNPDIISQLAVNSYQRICSVFINFLLKRCSCLKLLIAFRGSLDISFTFLQSYRNEALQTCSVHGRWKNSLGVCDIEELGAEKAAYACSFLCSHASGLDFARHGNLHAVHGCWNLGYEFTDASSRTSVEGTSFFVYFLYK